MATCIEKYKEILILLPVLENEQIALATTSRVYQGLRRSYPCVEAPSASTGKGARKQIAEILEDVVSERRASFATADCGFGLVGIMVYGE